MNNREHEHPGAYSVKLGRALKQARESVGYSVDELALTCGLTSEEITRLETGGDTDEARLRRVGFALGFDWMGLVETDNHR